jgi:Flp pilus assembly protein TadG
MSRSMTRRLLSKLRQFANDHSGVAALEFALIGPFMIVLYLGAVEISLALSIDRKITSAASALADLVAQDDVITDSEMESILAAGEAIIAPFDAGPLQLRVTSVFMSLDGDVEVQWSDAQGMAPYSEGGAIPVPSGVLQPNRSIVMVEVEYVYDTLFTELGVSHFEIGEVFYLRPRRSIVVARG